MRGSCSSGSAGGVGVDEVLAADLSDNKALFQSRRNYMLDSNIIDDI